MKKKIVAFLLLTTLVLSSTVVAFAETYDDGASHTVAGSENGVGAVGDGTDVTVNGDVSGSAEVTVGMERIDGGVVAADGAEISVTGNVSDSGFGAIAHDATINVTGSVEALSKGAVVNNGGTVNISKDVTGGMVSILSDNGGTVNVGGNANGTIKVTDATVNVGGNVTGSIEGDPSQGTYAYAAINETNSNINIEGNVTSKAEGIRTRGGSTIVVGGTLTADNESPVIIFDHSDYDVNNPNATPSTIVVYEIKGNLGNLVKSGYTNASNEFVEDTDSALKNSQIENIYYIIKKGEDDKDSNISFLSGTEKKAGYDTAKAGVSVVINVKEGFSVSAGKIAVSKNADGTYTIIVPKGGGVTLTTEAIQAAVEQAEQTIQAAVEQAEQTTYSISNLEQAEQTTYSISNPNATASAAVVVPPVYVTADPTTIGETAYVASVTAPIANAPYGGTVKLTTGDAAFINRSIIDALETRSDVTLEISVLYGGVPYLIHIPAGFKLRELLGSNGKINMNQLISMFGVQL